MLYRELVRRGVSDYVIAPVGAIDVVRSVCNLFSAPEAKAVGRIIAIVGAKGGVGASTIAHNVAWAIARDLALDSVVADLDLAFGTAGLDYNQDPPQGIADAVFSPGSGRYRVHRPPAVEMHRPSQPAGGAGDARPGLRFRRRGLRFDLRHAAHHDALHRARRSASMVGMDQARADRRRRHPDRRGARSRQSAQHQEHLRPAEGIAAERPRAALLPQPGRRAEAARDPRQRIRQGDRKPADRHDPVRAADLRHRPPTTAR